MVISNTNVDVCINKIKMIRPKINSRNRDLNSNIDWSIEYTRTEKKNMEHVCTLNAIEDMSIQFAQFAIKGFLQSEAKIEDLEKRSDELSSLILDKCMKTIW